MDNLGAFFDTEFPDLEPDKGEEEEEEEEEEKHNSNREYYAELAAKYRNNQGGASIEALITKVQKSAAPSDGKPGKKQSLDATLLSVNKQQRGAASSGAAKGVMILKPKANVWYGMPQTAQKNGPVVAGNAPAAAANGEQAEEIIPDYIRQAYIVLFVVDRNRCSLIKQLEAAKQKPVDELTGKLHAKLDVVPPVLERANMSPNVKARYFPSVRLGHIPPHKLNRPPPKPGASKQYQGEESREIKPDVSTDDDILNRDVKDYLSDRLTANLVIYLIHCYKLATSIDQAKPYEAGKSLYISAPFNADVEEASIVTLTGVTSSVLIKACYVQFGPSPGFEPKEEEFTTNLEATGVENTDNKLFMRTFLAVGKHTGYFADWMEPVSELVKKKIGFNLEEARKRFETPPNNDSFLRHNILISDNDILLRALETSTSDCVVTLLPTSGDTFWSTKQQTGNKDSPQQIDVSIHAFQWKSLPVVCENPGAPRKERFYRCYSSRLQIISGLLDSVCDQLKSFGIMSKDQPSWTRLAPRFIEFLRAGCNGLVRYFASERELEIALAAYSKIKENLDTASREFLQQYAAVDPDGTECLRVPRSELSFAKDLILKLALPVACYQMRVQRWMFDYAALIRSVGVRIPVAHAEFIINKKKKENLITTLPTKYYSDNDNVIIISDENEDDRINLLREWVKKGYEMYLVDPSQPIQTLKNLRQFSAKEIDILFSKEYRDGRPNARLEILKKNGIEDSTIASFVEIIKLMDGYIYAVNPNSTRLANESWKNLQGLLENFNTKEQVATEEQTTAVDTTVTTATTTTVGAGADTITITTTSATATSTIPPSRPPSEKVAKPSNNKEDSEEMEIVDKKKEEEAEEEKDRERDKESEEAAVSSRKKTAKRKAVAVAEEDENSHDGYSNSFVDEASQNPDSLNEGQDDDDEEERSAEESRKKKKVAKKSAGTKRTKRN